MSATPVGGILNKLQYAANEIASKGNDPHWWHQRTVSRIVGPVVSATRGHEGRDVMQADWDNLLILDACRADLFEEVIDTGQFDGYERTHSLGCSSPEWMRKTFGDRQFPDTVYVTANPWIAKIAPETFAHVRNLWTDDRDLPREVFEDSTGHDAVGNDGDTIHPDELNAAVREVMAEYPNKRVIVHYFQPHAPIAGYIDGEKRKRLDHERDPGDRLRRGQTTRHEVWEAYRHNTGYVWEYARQLAEDLGGKTVFTADHGELLGEWLWPIPMRGYAHPGGVRHPKLTEVPWAEVQHGERREIEAADGVEYHEADEAVVDQRLRDLGYAEV